MDIIQLFVIFVVAADLPLFFLSQNEIAFNTAQILFIRHLDLSSLPYI